MENNKLEKYNNLVSQNYKTLNEILDDNCIPRSQIKSIRKYADFLESTKVYHPKAKKEVNMYSQEVADEIIKYANLSKVEKSKAISLLKYGVESNSQLEENKKRVSELNKANSAERTEKRNKTNMEKYGTCDFINSDKAKKTIVEKYGSIENYNVEMGKQRKEKYYNQFEIFCKENNYIPLSKLMNMNNFEDKERNYKFCNLINELNIEIIFYENKTCIKNEDFNRLKSLLNI